VTVVFGELQKIDREIFQSGLKILLEDESFGEEIFQFDEEKAVFQCRRCYSEWNLDDLEDLGEEELEAIHFMPEAAHVHMRCKDCGSPDFSVLKGRGISISAMVLE
jgi:hydrogenase nickel incorporation protein HypA/HybF